MRRQPHHSLILKPTLQLLTLSFACLTLQILLLTTKPSHHAVADESEEEDDDERDDFDDAEIDDLMS